MYHQLMIDVNAHINDVKFIINEQTNTRVNIDCNCLFIFNLISFELLIVLSVCFLTNLDNLLIDMPNKNTIDQSPRIRPDPVA